MVGLPPIFEKFDTIWVIVHRLTILAYFVPIKVDYNVEKLAKIYLSEIVWLHSVPISISYDTGT